MTLTTQSWAGPVSERLKTIHDDRQFNTHLKALVEMGPAAIDELAQALLDERLGAHGRWVAAQALGQIGSIKAVKALVACKKAKPVPVRMACVQGLSQEASGPALSELPKFLNDKTQMVRSAVVTALLEHRPSPTIDLLSEELFHARNRTKKGGSLPIRQKIVWGLGQLQDTRARPALEKVLEEKPSALTSHACVALKQIYPRGPSVTGPKCGPAWKKWLKDT